jgi:hypothetical protein
MEKKIFKIKYVTNIGLGYWVDRFDGEFGTIGHYNVLLLPFCIIRWGTVTKIDPKPIWKQIIETCGGEEEFMKSAGLLPKEETLEESAESYAKPFDNRFWVVAAFKEGAKWQAERMYSEEDVEPLLNSLKYFTDRVESGTVKSKTTYKMYKEVLYQFKKK